jgi:hypothetical protein
VARKAALSGFIDKPRDFRRLSEAIEYARELRGPKPDGWSILVSAVDRYRFDPEIPSWTVATVYTNDPENGGRRHHNPAVYLCDEPPALPEFGEGQR